MAHQGTQTCQFDDGIVCFTQDRHDRETIHISIDGRMHLDLDPRKAHFDTKLAAVLFIFPDLGKVITERNCCGMNMDNLIEFQLNTPSGERTFLHRGTPADNGVLQQIFVNQDYSIARLARAGELLGFYQSVVDSGGQPLIVDCGANIGASAVWFSTVYPGAVVVAIEPEEGNFDLLVRNTHGMRIESQQAAIGSRQGQVHVLDPGLGAWGYRTAAEGSGPSVQQIAMQDLVLACMAKGRTPFIAKIDIEGGESELFSQATEWIDFFPLIIIELHDWMLPGSGNSRNFLGSVANRARDFVYIGENVFSIRNF